MSDDCNANSSRPASQPNEHPTANPTNTFATLLTNERLSGALFGAIVALPLGYLGSCGNALLESERKAVRLEEQLRICGQNVDYYSGLLAQLETGIASLRETISASNAKALATLDACIGGLRREE